MIRMRKETGRENNAEVEVMIRMRKETERQKVVKKLRGTNRYARSVFHKKVR